MVDRFQPRRGPGSSVYQSGLDLRPRGTKKPYTVTQGPMRAVVVETYVSDSEGLSEIGFEVEVDVVLVRSGLKLTRVPVMQRDYGVNNAEPWIPKKTTRVVSNNQPLNLEAVLSKRGTFQGAVTPLDDVDGDTVLVDYIEGDPNFPVVIGLLPHRQSNRKVIEGGGWSEASASGAERGTPQQRERYLRFAGFEFRINDQGDVLMDTVGATSDEVTENPATGGGQFRIRMKSSKRFTVEVDGIDVFEVFKDGPQVRVDIGEGATERVVLGDSFMALYNSHTHPDPVGGTTGVPTVQMTDALLSDLAKTKKV